MEEVLHGVDRAQGFALLGVEQLRKGVAGEFNAGASEDSWKTYIEDAVCLFNRALELNPENKMAKALIQLERVTVL